MNRKARRRIEAIQRKDKKRHESACEGARMALPRDEAAWMAWALDMMCFPRFLNRLIDPPQRNIELNWRLIGNACPTFDLLRDLDKKPYPLGFSSLKSFWGDHAENTAMKLLVLSNWTLCEWDRMRVIGNGS